MSFGSGFSPRRFLTEPAVGDGGIERDDGVGENQKVRPAAGAIDRIGRVGLSRIEVRPGRRRQVSARRETHDADAVGRHAELLRAGAHEADRPLRVAELDRVVIFRAEPVLEDERGHAGRIQQVGDLPPLVIGRERAVAAAWRDDDRRAGGLARAVDRQRGPIGILFPERSGSAVGPEEHGLGLGVGIGLGLRRRRRGRLRVNHSGTEGRSHRHGCCQENAREPHEPP